MVFVFLGDAFVFGHDDFTLHQFETFLNFFGVASVTCASNNSCSEIVSLSFPFLQIMKFVLKWLFSNCAVTNEFYLHVCNFFFHSSSSSASRIYNVGYIWSTMLNISGLGVFIFTSNIYIPFFTLIAVNVKTICNSHDSIL